MVSFTADDFFWQQLYIKSHGFIFLFLFFLLQLMSIKHCCFYICCVAVYILHLCKQIAVYWSVTFNSHHVSSLLVEGLWFLSILQLYTLPPCDSDLVKHYKMSTTSKHHLKRYMCTFSRMRVSVTLFSSLLYWLKFYIAFISVNLFYRYEKENISTFPSTRATWFNCWSPCIKVTFSSVSKLQCSTGTKTGRNKRNLKRKNLKINMSSAHSFLVQLRF